MKDSARAPGTLQRVASRLGTARSILTTRGHKNHSPCAFRGRILLLPAAVAQKPAAEPPALTPDSQDLFIAYALRHFLRMEKAPEFSGSHP